jgi:hypothetical protein
MHDTAALDETTQKVPPITRFHTGDVWKMVPALKALRPDLDVFTIATPWTGLTVVSGFGKTRYDSSWIVEARKRFSNAGFADIEADLSEALCLVANEWQPVMTRLRASLADAAQHPCREPGTSVATSRTVIGRFAERLHRFRRRLT